MLRKVVIITVLILSFAICIHMQSQAQTEESKTDLEKIIEINERITPETIEKFTVERNLKYIPIKPEEEIIKKRNEKKYYDFSYAEQKQIGRALVHEFLKDHNLYTSDPLIVKYVATIGKFVSSHFDDQDGYTYTFGIINEPNVRIYTFPGGYVFVTIGFLKTLENEAQLAASLAREIGSYNENLQMQTLINNQEAFSLLSSLKQLLYKGNSGKSTGLTEDDKEKAQEPFSDPFASLDYYASPNLENLFANKEYLTKKLLKKLLMIIPPYDTIVKKDLIAVETLRDSGYDVESAKDMILKLNKEQKQPQVINRTINIENWLGLETLKKRRANKIEGRYMMMVERLNY